MTPSTWRRSGITRFGRASHLPGQAGELGGPDRLREPPDVKRWMLWASLVLGALVLGWMAWRLSREMGAAPAARDAEAPPE